ncbi:MAG: hypothetical protein COU29_03355 [Candidatus Magasanikbacteria bacterium CG10_big_fil_rev_8_21_14_0_10_36_32]|uniref:Uncharacterized protein n=1 Tax=Candidatus Magasanikbacteria bacterium CG10_big_fil_rev_8_21_14_0_10_36_32 TaxID=1974646 RepID=A0A2M6W660_9BACT|nr:MAG: hypothetical protein COU29_03355 [Candidatus Magasanikbacteria bacterium CG10_big_fil_rev_8_21_14_0_10_36_32]
MDKDLIKDVQIVEPPMRELTKKKFGFAAACMSSCGFFILIIIGLVVGLKIYIGQGPQRLKTLPESFPQDISLYDEYNVDGITFISGKYKSRSIGIASLIPKIVLSPLFYSLKNEQNTGEQIPSTTKKFNVYNFWRLVTTPVSDNRDTIQIEWRDVQAEPSFLISFYKNKLRDKHFKIETESEGKLFKQFTFSRNDGIDGTVYTQHPENSKKINYAFLIVNIPATTTNQQ